MLSFDELENIWNTQIQPQIELIAQKHKRTIGIHIFIHVVVFAIASYVFFKVVLPSLWVDPEAGFFILWLVPNIIWGIVSSAVCSDYKKKIKSYYNLFLNPLGITHSLTESEYFDWIDIGNTNILYCNNCNLDDIFTGKYKGVPYQIAETTLKKISGSGKYTSVNVVFDGVMLVINDFIGVEETVSCEYGRFDRKKITEAQEFKIAEFVRELRTIIPHYKGLLFMQKKIFIFIEHSGNVFEVPNFNIQIDDFINMLSEVNTFLSYFDKMNLQEKYNKPQVELQNPNQEDTASTFWEMLGMFLLYFILGLVCAIVILVILMHVLDYLFKINIDFSLFCGSFVLIGVLFAWYLLKQDLDKQKKKQKPLDKEL